MHLAMAGAAQCGVLAWVQAHLCPIPPPARVVLYKVGRAMQTGPSLKGQCREALLCLDTGSRPRPVSQHVLLGQGPSVGTVSPYPDVVSPDLSTRGQ